MSLDAETIESLCPAVKDLVIWLNGMGYKTVDSGDGSNAEFMEGAMECPMVAIQVEALDLVERSNSLYELLKDHGVPFHPPECCCDNKPDVQGTYKPDDGQAVVLLLNITSDMVDLRSSS